MRSPLLAWQLMKYRKISRLWVGNGAECSRTEQEQKEKEQKQKKKSKIAISSQYPLPMVHVPMD